MDEHGRVHERATVTEYEPPVHGLEEAMWVAEDPDSGCVGVGRVEAEAVGNLVAVVDTHGHEAKGHVKLPGRVVERSWEGDDTAGLLDRVRDWL